MFTEKENVIGLALYDYSPSQPTELALSKGDLVKILKVDTTGNQIFEFLKKFR